MYPVNHSKQLVLVSITGADIAGTLMRLTDRNVLLYDIMYTDELTVMFYISNKDIPIVKSVAASRGDRLEQKSENCMQSVFIRLKRRLVLLLGVIVIFALSVWVPSRVFFIEVRGNERIEEKYIEEAVKNNGIHFGVHRSDIRSEAIKNTVLSAIPELDWVGITTAGCVATVEVREKPYIGKELEENYSVSSIVAAVDGVIEEITVTKGSALCKKGQAVREGQVLISAYEDCGFKIKASKAEGEVIAQTLRNIQAISPSKWVQRHEETISKTNYSIIFGKNIINLNNNSGISPAGCVKIYKEYSLILPGGFKLPFAIVAETFVSCRMQEITLPEEAYSWVEPLTEAYLKNQILAGQVLQKKAESELSNDLYVYQALFICREQIGKNRIEETLNYHGKYS